jgi:HD-GYP domain-containing protein (c-di-GMP phosphodiesterase class II)
MTSSPLGEVPVSAVGPVSSLDRSVHALDGTILLSTGALLSLVHLQLMKDVGIETVAMIPPETNPKPILKQITTRKVTAEELGNGEKRLVRALYGSRGSLRAPPGALLCGPLLEELKQEATEQELYRYCVDIGAIREQARNFHKTLEKMEQIEATVPAQVRLDPRTMLRDPGKELTLEKLEAEPDPKALEIRKSGPPLKASMKPAHRKARSPEQIREFRDLYYELSFLTDRILSKTRTDALGNAESIGRLAERIIQGVIEDHTLLINFVHRKDPQDYLRSHILNVVILSVEIGASMDLDAHALAELAYAAFFSDIGMLKVPERIREKPEPLNPEERLEVLKHPTCGINLLLKIQDIPFCTPLVVYQTHERADGSGYPKRRTLPVIHPYARIIAAADIFDAITTPRPYREAKTPYQAMEQLIWLAGNGKLDREVVRAFLRVVSLFPIGSWVRLDDGHLGKVTASHGDAYARPVVQCFFRNGKRLKEPRVIDLKTEERVKVISCPPNHEQEAEWMEGF